jgi:hypothetical protein
MGDGRPVRRSPPGATRDASRVVRRPVFARPWWLLPVGRLPPLWWVLIAAFLLAVDIVTGPKTQFPVVYAIPVILAAWYSGRWPGLALAIGIPSIHLVLLLALWNDAGSTATLLATTAIRMAVVSALAFWFARLSEHERALDRHVHTLEGLLPLCSFCKSIRNESGEWTRLETFIAERSDAQFSHAFCPACWRAHYPELGDPPN